MAAPPVTWLARALAQPLCERCDCLDRGRVGVYVDRRKAVVFGAGDRCVLRNHEDLEPAERCPDQLEVVFVADTVRDDDYRTVGTRRFGSAARDFERLRARLRDDQYGIKYLAAQTQHRAEPGLEVSDHPPRLRLQLPEQLLGRYAASRSAGIDAVEPRDDYEPDTVG